jgi:3-isopropylmalate dehydrogenase
MRQNGQRRPKRPVEARIALLPGDGIGPEVLAAAARVLEECGNQFGHRFEWTEYPVGGAAIDRVGSPLPAETLEGCCAADAVLLGAVGGPNWDGLPIGRRPERGLLALRQALGLYANVRPCRIAGALAAVSPLRTAAAAAVDLEVVRELAGGIYFGARKRETGGQGERAEDVESYTVAEIERIARFAFLRARRRRGRLVSVDKANVLATSELWRRTVTRLAVEFPEVETSHQYVDNAAMQLVLAPGQFDVLLTSNLFGDILSDLAAGVVGSIGLVPSMSAGSGPSLYEPIHGSAPALAGKDAACPVGAILSVAMMLRESFGLAEEAAAVEGAVEQVLADGYRTADLAADGGTVVGCARFSALVVDQVAEVALEAEPYGWGV